MSTSGDGNRAARKEMETAQENAVSRRRSPSPEGRIALTFERGYYHCDRLFIKRSLRPSEFRMSQRGLHIPYLGKERLQNEADSLRFIQRTTNIPVPTVYGAFEVDESFFLITEYIEGISMADISEDEKKIVQAELSQHLATLRNIKSNTIGGPSGILIPPYRVTRASGNRTWSTTKPSENAEYVFCHNDLSQPNVIVNPDTMKIRAIIDWEYAGFFPEYFEASFYKRLGPSIALNDEHDDVKDLIEFLDNCSKE